MEKVGVGGSTIKEGEAGEERKGISPSVYKCACRKNASMGHTVCAVKGCAKQTRCLHDLPLQKKFGLV